MKKNNNFFFEKKEGDFPLEYSKGKILFLNCEINLSKRPFIPRIETEFWVKKAIKEIKKSTISSTRNALRSDVGRNKQLTILDVFAGSGCIGISILKNIKNTKADFIDIGDKALSQIRSSLKSNKIPKTRYRIIKSNLFQKLKGERYDVIFANPPYVALNRINEVGSSVLKYEPKNALFGGEDGLFYIKKFLNSVKKFLNKNGKIYLEFDPLQMAEIIKILKENKFKNFKFFKDQFKKYRWVKIWI